MYPVEKSLAQQSATVTYPVPDHAERQRRLGQVYALLIDLAQRRKARALTAPGEEDTPASC